MKNQRATEIKVGLTVIVGILVFIWILGWAKNFSLSANAVELKLMFDNVSGLEIGNEVTVNGVRKGYVRDFYVYKTYVIVTVTVSNDVELKKDAQFALELTDLMGGRKIEINPGYENEPLDLDATHRGVYKTDFAGLVSILSNMSDDVQIILKDVKTSLGVINTYLTDEDFNKEVRQSVVNLTNLTGRLDKILLENRDDFRSIANNTKELTKDTKELIKTNKESINSSIHKLNSLLEKSDSLVSRLNYFTEETSAGGNNLGKLLYDDSLYTSLTKSLQQLNELSKVLLMQLKTDGLNVDVDLF